MIYIDSYNVLFHIYSEIGKKHCDPADFIEYSKIFIQMFNLPNVKCVWYFDGPAASSKDDTIISRQLDRYNLLKDAYYEIKDDNNDCIIFYLDFLNQSFIVDSFCMVLRDLNCLIHYCTSECDQYIFIN